MNISAPAGERGKKAALSLQRSRVVQQAVCWVVLVFKFAQLPKSLLIPPGAGDKKLNAFLVTLIQAGEK